MSANSLGKLAETVGNWKWLHKAPVMAIILPLWILFGLTLATLVTYALLYILNVVGISLAQIDGTVLDATLAAVVYALTIVFVVWLPQLFRRYVTTKELGLTRLPSWMDILLAPAGFIVYFIASSLIVYTASQLFSGFDMGQAQETGFQRLTQYYEYALAFVTLIIVAPLAEEILFRGFLYGKLRKRMPLWVAMLITSALFGLIHGQWNVGLDVFALSIVLCSLREITGSIWAGILLHMIKNSIAFFIIFIAPML
jgi:membrane protease YdiL (CAAX protease family)